MSSGQTEPGWLDYFSGGVPTGEFFRITLKDLSLFIDRSSEDRGINRRNEVCFIGLVSYFEAFCKDHFASILNIEPSLLDNLAKQGKDVTIDPTDLLAFGNDWVCRLGFLVAQKYDFGTAHKINNLYTALVNVTPFSKDDARLYDDILRNRNLLVHHGGTYTLSYLRQVGTADAHLDAFLNSLVVTADYFDNSLSFIEGIARKMLNATHSALGKYINERGFKYSNERKGAMDAFLWEDDRPNSLSE